MPKPKPENRFKKDSLRVFVYAQSKDRGGQADKRPGQQSRKKEMPTAFYHPEN